VLAVGVCTAALHLYQTATYALPAGQFKNLHVGLSLLIVYLSLGEASRDLRRLTFIVLAACSLVPLIYIHVEFVELIGDRMFEASGWDTSISIMLVVLTLTATAFQWGLTIPIIAVASLLYARFGMHLPGELLFHSGLDLVRVMSYASIPFFQGVLGSLTSMSASVVFIFMLLAGLLKATGGIDFIMTCARAVSGNARSGPAQVAVISSGLMGMISGSTVANVASTGSITIPMMQRSGFRAEHAAAVEAVASTGGQFSPPVMGLTAFLIVGMTGIPYNEIILAAAFPALVYYGYLLAAVDLQYRMNSTANDALPVSSTPSASARAALLAAVRQYGHLLIAMAVLIYLLVIQMPPAFAAVHAMVVIASTEIAKQMWLSRRTPWQGIDAATRILAKGLADGARSGAELAVVIAAIGIFVDVLVTTGFAQKLSYLLLDFASGDLWLMLALTALACLVFGLGMPTPAAYILVALLGVPALERVGVPQLSAHMFVFYFANMSAITPPVAVAALVAAKLASASYFRTAFAACRLGLAGFVLPFLFVYAPEILLIDGSVVEQWLTFFGALLALVAFNMGLVGYAVGALSKTQRVALVVAAMAVLQFTSTLSYSGATLIVAILALQRFANAKTK
jgi:TRAP transporter 4TM/12TM fusion protein